MDKSEETTGNSVSESAHNTEVMKRLLEETLAMHKAITHAVLNWASLENAMAFLMSGFFQGGSLGMALYYTPNSTEARISLLTTCFHDFADAHPSGKLFYSCWQSLEKRISRLKRTRNRIVHGNIMTYCGPDRVSHIRLMYPIFDHSPANRDRQTQMENIRKSSAGDRRYQIPGMSSSDVSGSASAYHVLEGLCNRLRIALFHANDVEGIRGILELANEILPQGRRPQDIDS